MTFTANVNSGSQENPTYNWTVSQGEIVSGQGSPVITVQTTPEMAGGNVTATVTVGGLCADCRENTASEVAGIAPVAVGPNPIDSFGPLSNVTIVKATYLITSTFNWQNDPGSQGYIINYGSARDIAKREKEIFVMQSRFL